jgi:transcriptional regulator with XRE-family HTH domain
MPMDQRQFGYKLKYHRKRQGMTQSELGKKLGVSQVTIANYERGLRFPKENLLKALGEQLSVSLDELFYNSNDGETLEVKTDYKIERLLHILLSDSLENGWKYITGWKMKSFLSVKNIFYDIFIPLLKLMGDWWFQSRIIVSQEHLVSEKIRILIVKLIQEELEAGNSVTDNDKRWMGVCAPSEQHELVLFMASQIMILQGWNVYYLGKDVPISDLNNMLIKVKPHVLVISITMVENRNGLEIYLKNLINHGKRRVIVGGKGINAQICHSFSQDIIYARTLQETLEKSLSNVEKEDIYE